MKNWGGIIAMEDSLKAIVAVLLAGAAVFGFVKYQEYDSEACHKNSWTQIEVVQKKTDVNGKNILNENHEYVYETVTKEVCTDPGKNSLQRTIKDVNNSVAGFDVKSLNPVTDLENRKFVANAKNAAQVDKKHMADPNSLHANHEEEQRIEMGEQKCINKGISC